MIYNNLIRLGVVGAVHGFYSQKAYSEAKRPFFNSTPFQSPNIEYVTTSQTTSCQAKTSGLFTRVLENKAVQMEWKEKYFFCEFRNNTSIHDSEITRHRRLLEYKQGSNLFDYDTFEIPGIALIATYLKEKKGLKGLFVCESHESFIGKIKEIAKTQNQHERYAFIIETRARGQKHKICIGVERKKEKLCLVALDSLGSESSCSAYFFNYVRVQCKKESIDLCFVISSVRRQFGSSGCSIFALQDAVSFLQDPDFLAKVEIESRVEKDVSYITRLSPAFMIGMQSVSQFIKYKEDIAEVEKEDIPGRKKTLEEYFNQNCIKPNDPAAAKQQNHYITKKILWYQSLIIGALKTSSSEDLKATINKSLIRR